MFVFGVDAAAPAPCPICCVACCSADAIEFGAGGGLFVFTPAGGAIGGAEAVGGVPDGLFVFTPAGGGLPVCCVACCSADAIAFGGGGLFVFTPAGGAIGGAEAVGPGAGGTLEAR